MTLTHTMTLTDREANLLHRWAKAELEKDDAVAAAWVLNGLIENHVQKWVENKWKEDAAERLIAELAPILEKDTIKVIHLWRGGPTLTAEDYATVWNASAHRKDFAKALRRHLVHTQQDTAFDAWLERLGERNSLQRLTMLARQCRGMGFDLKRAGSPHCR